MKYALFSILICLQAPFQMQAFAEGQTSIILPSQQADQTPMHYTGSFALLVGVSQYDQKNWPQLPNVTHELDRLQEVLTHAGFQISRVDNPDHEQLDLAFRDFFDAHANVPHHRLLVYFAGHGYSLKVGDLSRGFLAPTDAPHPKKDKKAFIQKSLQMEQLVSWSSRISAKHVLFLFDCCLSDTAFDTGNLPAAFPPHITKLTDQPSKQFITAGRSNETAPLESVFNKVIVNGLNNGEADRNNDKYILGTELGLYVLERMAKFARTTPQMGKFAKMGQGEFVTSIPTDFKKSQLVLVKPPAISPSDIKKKTPAVFISARQEKEYAYIASMYESLGEIGLNMARDEIEGLIKQYPESTTYNYMKKKVLSNFLPKDVGQDYTNTLGMKMMYVPATTGRIWSDYTNGKDYFLMGNRYFKKQRRYNEKLVQIRLTKPYLMGSTEVTQLAWLQLMKNNPSKYKGDQLPVTNVNWHEAIEFCKRLSQREGFTYTLPTEAEWEFACRAGTTGDWAGGSEMAWFSKNSGGKPHPVGLTQPNLLGLFDMHGNAWEWCSNWFGSYPLKPTSDPLGPNFGYRRAIRGGSYTSSAQMCRSAVRSSHKPISRTGEVGFRVIMRLEN